TRFCYMGERRLAVMETMLPDDAWVLGIDEHTVLIVDLDARTVAVSGRGNLTVRRRGAAQVFAAGQKLGLDTLLAAGRGDTARTRAWAPAPPGRAPPGRRPRRSGRRCSPRWRGSSRCSRRPSPAARRPTRPRPS